MSAVKLLGKYYLQEKIASSTASHLYRGMEIGSNGFERMVLIHRLKDEVVRDEARRAELERVVAMLEPLRHPNVSRVLELTNIREEWILVREWVHGTSLRVLLSRLAQAKQSLTQDECLYIVRELLQALEAIELFAESSGQPLVHGRIHPDNVLLGYNGGVKLIGLGLGPLYAGRETVPTDIASLPYRSPEELQGKPIDQRADIFGAGAILFEILLGKSLFLGEDNDETKTRILAGLGMQQAAERGLARDMSQFVCKAVEARRDWRFLGAADALEALHSLAPRLPLAECRRHLAARLETIFEADQKREREKVLEEHRTLAKLLGTEPPPEEQAYERTPQIARKITLDPWDAESALARGQARLKPMDVVPASAAAQDLEAGLHTGGELESLVFDEDLSLTGFAAPPAQQPARHEEPARPAPAPKDVVLASDLAGEVVKEKPRGNEARRESIEAATPVPAPAPEEPRVDKISLVYNDELPPLIPISTPHSARPRHTAGGPAEPSRFETPTPSKPSAPSFDLAAILGDEPEPRSGPAPHLEPELIEPPKRPTQEMYRPPMPEKPAPRLESAGPRRALESREAWRRRLEDLSHPQPVEVGRLIAQIAGVVALLAALAVVLYLTFLGN